MANSWRRERWNSLRLLTPNWQTRLPGQGYEGADPDGISAKWAIDAIVKAGVLKDDSPKEVKEVRFSQEKIGTEFEEDTIITLSTPAQGRCIQIGRGHCAISALRLAHRFYSNSGVNGNR